MLDAIQAEEGYAEMLFALLDGGRWWAHLYTNDPPLSKAMRKADFVELVAGGYSPLGLDRWTPPGLRRGVAVSFADPLIWLINPIPTPPAVRGYYVTNQRDGALLWAWRRPGPAWQSVPLNATLIVYVQATWPMQC